MRAEWAEMIRAAGWTWRSPEIGRKLHAIARRVGYAEVAVQVLTMPDTGGCLLGMIETVTGCARDGEALDPAWNDTVLRTVESGIAERTCLAVAP